MYLHCAFPHRNNPFYSIYHSTRLPEMKRRFFFSFENRYVFSRAALWFRKRGHYTIHIYSFHDKRAHSIVYSLQLHTYCTRLYCFIIISLFNDFGRRFLYFSPPVEKPRGRRGASSRAHRMWAAAGADSKCFLTMRLLNSVRLGTYVPYKT